MMMMMMMNFHENKDCNEKCTTTSKTVIIYCVEVAQKFTRYTRGTVWMSMSDNEVVINYRK